jgi:hypothetical protein
MGMKVKVTFTLDVDEVAWCMNYGVNINNKPEIRRDVQSYFQLQAQEQLIYVNCHNENPTGT